MSIGEARKFVRNAAKNLGPGRRYQVPVYLASERNLRKAFQELRKSGVIPRDLIWLSRHPEGGGLEMWIGRLVDLQDKLPGAFNAIGLNDGSVTPEEASR